MKKAESNHSVDSLMSTKNILTYCFGFDIEFKYRLIDILSFIGTRDTDLFKMYSFTSFFNYLVLETFHTTVTCKVDHRIEYSIYLRWY